MRGSSGFIALIFIIAIIGAGVLSIYFIFKPSVSQPPEVIGKTPESAPGGSVACILKIEYLDGMTEDLKCESVTLLPFVQSSVVVKFNNKDVSSFRFTPTLTVNHPYDAELGKIDGLYTLTLVDSNGIETRITSMAQNDIKPIPKALEQRQQDLAFNPQLITDKVNREGNYRLKFAYSTVVSAFKDGKPLGGASIGAVNLVLQISIKGEMVTVEPPVETIQVPLGKNICAIEGPPNCLTVDKISYDGTNLMMVVTFKGGLIPGYPEMTSANVYSCSDLTTFDDYRCQKYFRFTTINKGQSTITYSGDLSFIVFRGVVPEWGREFATIATLYRPQIMALAGI